MANFARCLYRRTKPLLKVTLVAIAMAVSVSLFLFRCSPRSASSTEDHKHLYDQAHFRGPQPVYAKASSTRSNQTVFSADVGIGCSSLKPEVNKTRLEQVVDTLRLVIDDESVWNGSSFFKPRSTIMTSFKPKVLIDSVRCHSRGPYVLLLIPSPDFGLNSLNTRNAIRSTWASPAYGAAWPNDTRNFTSLVKVVFFLGVDPKRKGPTSLNKEAQMHGDIVQMDFQESYQNLSLKMALALEWSTALCPGASHVMKVDTDTFVDLPFLLAFLQRLQGLGFPQFLVGYGHYLDQPVALRRSKWRVAPEVYPFKYYPRYVYGHSYVLSSEAVRRLSGVWRYMPLLPNEDAFLTGVLAKVVGITRIHCDWFAVQYIDLLLMPPRQELAKGRSISQTGFKRFRLMYGMWDMVKKAYSQNTNGD